MWACTRFSCLLLVVAVYCSLCVSIYAQGSVEDNTQNISQNDTLYIVQDRNWAPLAFADKEGVAQGLLIDLWRAVGQKTGRAIDIELVDWQHTLRMVQESPQRVHGGLFNSAERNIHLDFSEPLMQLRTTLFVSSVSTTKHILQTKDLTMQVVGITAGSYEEEFMRANHPHITLRLFNNNDQLVDAAVRGKIEAFVADYPVGMYYLDQYTTPDKFRVLAVLYEQPIYAAVAKGNTALLAEINAGLATISSQQMTAITQKWMNSTQVNVTPPWALPLALAIVVLLFLAGLLWHNKLLSKRVAVITDALREQKKQVLVLTQNMSDWVWTTNSSHQFTYVSPSIKKLLGYDAEEIIGQHWGKILHPGESERAYSLDTHLAAAAKRGEIIDYQDVTLDISLLTKQGGTVWTEAAMRVFFDNDGNYAGAQGSSRNITERKQAEEAIRQLAFSDPLTHLPNRRLLSDRLKQAMAGCSRHHQYSALFYLDLDNFKYINDNHGHDNGDALLQQVAQRLSANSRESDTVARFGGDEFALVSEYLGQDINEAKQHALRIAVKTLELFDKSFVLRDTHCQLTTSIGIIFFNSDQKSVSTLIKQADLALYQAKAKGRNQFFVAEP